MCLVALWVIMCKTFQYSVGIRCRSATTRGGGATERCQAPGAAALHHPAHRGAPAHQRERADWTTGGPQLSAPALGEGEPFRLSPKHKTPDN